MLFFWDFTLITEGDEKPVPRSVVGIAEVKIHQPDSSGLEVSTIVAGREMSWVCSKCTHGTSRSDHHMRGALLIPVSKSQNRAAKNVAWFTHLQCFEWLMQPGLVYSMFMIIMILFLNSWVYLKVGYPLFKKYVFPYLSRSKSSFWGCTPFFRRIPMATCPPNKSALSGKVSNNARTTTWIIPDTAFNWLGYPDRHETRD